LLHRSFLSLANVLPAALLTESLVSFTRRGSLRRSFLSLADVLPASPLAVSLISFSCRRPALPAARCIASFFLLRMFCPLRRSLNRSFLSLADALSVAPLAESLVSFSCGRLASCAAH
jgi:hypothetical protein